MNIFVLDEDPSIAAKYHADKHVNKMILESVQILNTAIHIRADEDDYAERYTFYRPTHKSHPVVEWVAESFRNWRWLYELTVHLNEEYLLRYVDDEEAVSHDWNQRDVYHPDKWHKSFRKASDAWGGPKWHQLRYRVFGEEDEPMTKWALAMPDEYHSPDTVEAYRDYYRNEKQPQDWFEYSRGRSAPNWL